MLIGILLVCVSAVWSAPVGRDIADVVAQDWAYLHGWHLQEAGWTPKSSDAEPQTEFVCELASNDGEVVAYKYRFPTGGEVVIANEDSLPPIFFYSETNTFDPDANPTARYLFDTFIAALQCGRNGNKAPNTAWTNIPDKVYSLRSSQVSSQTLADSSIGPLIQTRWTQESPYNLFCPSDSEGKKCIVGCVATAMAQILRYWNKPASFPNMTIAYVTNTHGIHVGPVNISTRDPDWENMPATISLSGSSDKQILAVSWLCYVCGLTVYMDYGADESGAYTVLPEWYDYPCATTAYQDILGFTNAVGIYRSDFSSTWDTIMKNQIAKGQPVQYSGYDSFGGHSFVLDGVRDTADGYLFHYNLGWAGTCDGWYSSTNVPNGCYGYNFSQDQNAIVDIYQGNRYSLTVNISPTDAGFIMQNTSSNLYSENTNIRLKAIARSGYAFDHWEGDLSGINATTTITMDSDKSVTAVFTTGYKICSRVHGNGSISASPSKSAYTADESVTLEAVPETGWKFDHWTGSITGSESSVTLTMNSDKIIHAYFVQAYSVTVIPTGEGSVTRSDTGPFYKPNAQLTLTAVPADGWVFHKWRGDVNSTDSSITITMNSDKVIQAEFINPDIDTYSLTVSTTGSGNVTPFGGLFAKNSSTTLTATPVNGWKFVQWRGDIVSTVNPLTVAMDGDKSLTAVFALANAEMPANETVDGNTSKTTGTTAQTAVNDSEFEFSNLITSCAPLSTVLMLMIAGGFVMIRIKE